MPRAFGTGAGTHADLLRIKRLAAFGAHDDRIEILAAQIVGVQQRAAFLARHVDIGFPLHFCRGLNPRAKVLDRKDRMRYRGCGARGRAVVSIKWAKSVT